MTFESQHQQALHLLQQLIPEDVGKNKPLLPHLLRVGKFLYDNGYREDVVNAGLLHDMIEWTQHPEQELRDVFGQQVYDIVLANTKNRNITDPIKRREDYVRRCADVGIDALIVKAADALDSYHYYQTQGNKEESDRAVHIAQLILKHVSPSDDPIFEQLQWIV